jgi:activator of HSP90 ATPase
MRSVIQQSVILAASAQSLYAMYLDPVVHAEITGLPVDIDTKPGSPFRAFDGNLSGQMLTVVEPRLIVQSWRSVHFNDGDPDSTLILTFTPEGAAGRIDLIHLDVPSHDYLGVTDGWETHYWAPWRRYLARDGA